MQTRLTLYVLAYGLCLSGVMLLILNSYAAQIREIVMLAPNLSMTTQLNIDSAISSMILVALLFLIVAVLATIAFGVIVTHRIAGPMHAILAYIALLREGKFDQRRPLRPTDELVPVMNALNELADHLNTKSL